MRLIECLHTQSKCYNASNNKITPVGIVVHSTGANNTFVKRYAQPSTSDPNYYELRALIGINKYGNHWNRNVSKGTHYIIGKIDDGSTATIKMLPENIACWGIGKGKNGSYNYDPVAHIQFEICEDNLKSESYFKAIYKEAIELCADICKRYGWSSKVIVSHKEAHAKGYGTNHSDIDHWLKKYNLTMDDFRKEVDTLLKAPEPETKPSEPAVIKVGDKVKLVDGAKWYDGKSIKSWLFAKTLYVRQIQIKNRKTVLLLSTYEKLPSYTGRVYPELVKKV